MLFDLPHEDVLYEALLSRDASFEGRAWVCVASTGIFCRLTCPARKPLRENCTFHDSIGACIETGFRPCKRCHPLGPAAQSDPMIATLLGALNDRPEYIWRQGDVERLGFDASTVRRSFKRHFGMTFLEMARQTRLRLGFETLSTGDKVINAQVDAGFESPSAFRNAFAKLLGITPGALCANAWLKAEWLRTPLGDMIAVADKTHLHLLEFTDRKALPTELNKLQKAVSGGIGIGRTEITNRIETELAAYFEGRSSRFDTPLALHGTGFTQDVWRALIDIPAGQTRSYGQLAKDMGRPTASRAVARANGSNQIALVIPCHRVIGADGSLTGYGGGLWRKQRLLEIEAQFR